MACVRSAITGRAPCSATARAMAANSAGLTWNPGSVWNRFGLINTSAPGRQAGQWLVDQLEQPVQHTGHRGVVGHGRERNGGPGRLSHRCPPWR